MNNSYKSLNLTENVTSQILV